MSEGSDHVCFTPNEGERCIGGWLWISGKMTALCQCKCHDFDPLEETR